MTGTTNLNLTKPTVGGDTDSWGAEINTDLDTLDATLAGAIYGLTLSAAGSTATFGVAAGAASGMALGSAYTKTTSAWAVGSGNGALDTGSIANSTWYHVWLIQRSDTGVVDILVSTSASSPTMPSNYDRKRRIGSMKTDGSAQWVKFSQIGDEFLWGTPVADATSAAPGATTAFSVTLTVPTGVQVGAILNLLWSSGTSSYAYLSSLDQTDVAASVSAFSVVCDSDSTKGSGRLQVRTNTSAQIRARFSTTSGVYSIVTSGWVDRRGQ